MRASCSPLWAPLALLAACAPDRAVAPEDIASPVFLLGTTPTNSLLGGTPTFTYSAVDRMVTVELGINRGIYTASRSGEADFRIETQLTVTNDAGQRIVNTGECPVADLKVEFIDDASQLLVVSFSVPWDGNDAIGEAMGGDVAASYVFEIVHATGALKTIAFVPVGKPLVGATVLGGSGGNLDADDPNTELIGQTPTNRLIGTTPTITYSGADGGFTVMISVNRGIYEASHMGEADFRIATQFTVTNDAGQRIIDGGECPVADLKVEFIDDASQLLRVSFTVAWDGKDGNGNAMTGDAMVSYSFQLLHAAGGQVVDPNVDLRAVGRPVTGSVAVSLGAGTQLQ